MKRNLLRRNERWLFSLKWDLLPVDVSLESGARRSTHTKRRARCAQCLSHNKVEERFAWMRCSVWCFPSTGILSYRLVQLVGHIFRQLVCRVQGCSRVGRNCRSLRMGTRQLSHRQGMWCPYGSSFDWISSVSVGHLADIAGNAWDITPLDKDVQDSSDFNGMRTWCWWDQIEWDWRSFETSLSTSSHTVSSWSKVDPQEDQVSTVDKTYKCSLDQYVP